ncbi:hypothetical protein TUBRATIS_001200 [Tubulinosema ratisbonensis]|uniref:Uncharacterized protein n=1 Tax=Tubulinosema ratisbonensis TaxID=291195 RepID=A0A437AQ81_9MICR|nr:hypothetical protein TUBRATIS_001200 [Tubulinosema ratisbonensis]
MLVFFICFLIHKTKSAQSTSDITQNLQSAYIRKRFNSFCTGLKNVTKRKLIRSLETDALEIKTRDLRSTLSALLDECVSAALAYQKQNPKHKDIFFKTFNEQVIQITRNVADAVCYYEQRYQNNFVMLAQMYENGILILQKVLQILEQN